MSLMDDEVIVMVVVDGVRYRPEDAPEPPEDAEPKQERAPANKAAEQLAEHEDGPGLGDIGADGDPRGAAPSAGKG